MSAGDKEKLRDNQRKKPLIYTAQLDMQHKKVTIVKKSLTLIFFNK